MSTYEEIRARLAARPDAAKRCGSYRAKDPRQCWLERGHSDRPHLAVTHHVTDGQGEYKGLGWTEWDDSDELVSFPERGCPHPSGDRASCRESECMAWRHAIVTWAQTGKRPGDVMSRADRSEP